MAEACSILIVDDSPEHAELLRDLLESEEMEVALAASGCEALEILAARSFDVLLTDLAMPGMDGIKLLKKVRPLYPKLPVIVITCFGDVRSAVRAMQAGAFSYFCKGSASDELLHEVHKALQYTEEPGLSVQQSTPEAFVFEQSWPGQKTPDAEQCLSLKEVRDQAEAEHIISVLNRVGGNRSKAAKALGITYRQLYNRLKDIIF